MPTRMRGKTMQRTSTTKKKRRRSPRKNPAGMFDQDFLKDSMWPMALGFANEWLKANAGKFKFWDKQGPRNRMLLLVVAGAYARSKGRPDVHGACLALAGVYAHQWQAEKKGLKAPAPAPTAADAEGQAAGSLTIQDLYEAADREMEDVDVGATFHGDDDDSTDPADFLPANLGAIWEPEQEYAAA